MDGVRWGAGGVRKGDAAVRVESGRCEGEGGGEGGGGEGGEGV